MKVILTGGTGSAGLGVLRSALADTSISKVTVLSRRPLPKHFPASEKITRIEHTDFLTYPTELLSSLKDHGACIWALGKSAAGMNEDEYTRITYDFAMAALKAFAAAGLRGEDGKFRFIYVSGEGARTDEKGVLFARVKGRAEKDLTAFASETTFVQVYNIRPAYFYPSDPQDAATTRPGSLRMMDKVLGPITRTFMPSFFIKNEDLGLFMLEAGKGRVEPGTFSNAQMRKLLKEWKEEDAK